MSRIQSSAAVANVTTLEDLRRFTQIWLDNATDVINGNLEFGTNIKSAIVEHTFAAANTNFAVSHNLGRVPLGYIQAGANVAVSIYDGTGTNTDKIINLKASAISNVKLLLF